MGVLNVTPDSFYDGGKYSQVDHAMERVRKMILEGADVIDVGGMSSRPGAEIICYKEEADRVVPTIEAIAKLDRHIIISIDTVHSSVAEAAISAGASMINDISGGGIDPSITDVAIRHHVPYILMHMQGTPETMQDDPTYQNVVLDILSDLKHKVHYLRSQGLIDLIVDPGFGFGKTLEQNYTLLRKLSIFKILNTPLLAGLSRKSMIYKLLDNTPAEALNGTTAAHMVALMNGASILRVHDVKEAVECMKIYNAMI